MARITTATGPASANGSDGGTGIAATTIAKATAPKPAAAGSDNCSHSAVDCQWSTQWRRLWNEHKDRFRLCAAYADTTCER